MPTRWLMSYRYSESRALTEDEIELLKSSARVNNIKAYAFASVTVVSFATSIILIAAAATWPPLVALVIVSSIIGFALLSIANRFQNLALLLGRTVRLGMVDRYRANARPLGFWSPSPNPNAATVYGWEEEAQYGFDWRSDERFELELAKILGRRPEYIETPINDPVVVFVDSSLCRRANTLCFDYLHLAATDSSGKPTQSTSESR